MGDPFYTRLRNDLKSIEILRNQAKGMLDFIVKPSLQDYAIVIKNIESLVGTTPYNYIKATEHEFNIKIPPGYPNRHHPNVFFKKTIFHPNWWDDGRLCYGEWESNTTLSEFVIDIVRMMQFDIVNTKSPANHEANSWYIQNKNIIDNMIKKVQFPPPLDEDECLEIGSPEGNDDGIEFLTK